MYYIMNRNKLVSLILFERDNLALRAFAKFMMIYLIYFKLEKCIYLHHVEKFG